MAEIYWFFGNDCYTAEVFTSDVEDIVRALKADGAKNIHIEYTEA